VRVFISYSRAQFYCAEELALALGQLDVDAWFDVHRLKPGHDWNIAILDAVRAADCVVLVASSEAIASPHVKSELTLAHELGMPVVVALTGRTLLPDSLAAAPRLDLQRGFEASVRLLSTALEQDDLAMLSGVPPSWQGPRPHPLVQVVTAILLLAALLFAAGAVLYRFSAAGTALFATLLPLEFALMSAAYVWLAWAFARRRAGTMIALEIACAFAVLCAATDCGLFIYRARVTPGFGVAPAIISALVAYLMVVVCVPVLRSRPLYRWLATGDAPQWLRRRMLARRGHRMSTMPQPSATSTSFDIHCHERDASEQRALELALQHAGHRRAEGDNADHHILVLSNLTPLDWLNQALAHLGGEVIVLIATPVLLRALEHVERYQWVDHRRRRSRTLERLAASIGGGSGTFGADLVPESLDRPVIPIGVFLLCGWYGLSAALGLSSAIVLLGSADFRTMYGGPRSPLPLLLVALGVCLLLWAATAIVRRRIPLHYVFAIVVANSVAGVALTRLLYPDLSNWICLSAIVGPLVLLISWRSLARWLPRRAVRSVVATLGVVAPAWWQRPVTGLFAVATAVSTLFLVATLNATPVSDKQAIRHALARFQQASARHDYGTLCDDLLATSYVRETASSGAPCEVALTTALESVRSPTLQVLSVEVHGDHASAHIRGSADGQAESEDIYALVREAGAWRILPPHP
jgi:hypothetical protein